MSPPTRPTISIIWWLSIHNFSRIGIKGYHRSRKWMEVKYCVSSLLISLTCQSTLGIGLTYAQLRCLAMSILNLQALNWLSTSSWENSSQLKTECVDKSVTTNKAHQDNILVVVFSPKVSKGQCIHSLVKNSSCAVASAHFVDMFLTT